MYSKSDFFYQSTIILKVRFFFTSKNWHPVNEELDWWNSVPILTTLTSDHKKNLNIIGHNLRELFDFEENELRFSKSLREYQ